MWLDTRSTGKKLRLLRTRSNQIDLREFFLVTDSWMMARLSTLDDHFATSDGLPSHYFRMYFV